jgi:hypothetical protein
MSYDAKMEVLHALMSVDVLNEEAVDAVETALDAMAFVATLHQSLVDNGAKLTPEPDTDEVGTTLDHIFGELSAACLYLSESSFARVPDMLRVIADGLDKENVPWTDPEGVTAPPVPAVVIRGFRHFAKRLEATKVQKQRAINQLRKVGV